MFFQRTRWRVEYAAGPEAEVVRTAPVALVVDGAMAGPGIVGDFVVLKTGVAQQVHRGEKLIGVAVLAGIEFTAAEAGEEFGVLLVGEIVAGDVVGAKGDGFLKALAPGRHREPGNGEHEVEVHAGDLRGAQGVVDFQRFLRRVVAAQQLQRGFVPGLHTEADARDAEFAQQRVPWRARCSSDWPRCRIRPGPCSPARCAVPRGAWRDAFRSASSACHRRGRWCAV